jgi:uncharacterized protein (TIGR02246 family)
MSLEDLTEIEAIRQLKARYFRLMDTKAWEEWADVFTRDARLQWGPEESDAFEGRDQIVAGVSSALEGAVTCHQGHMPEIELLGETSAKGVWAMSDLIDHSEFDLRGYGHYFEEYSKQDGRWRIRNTRLTRLREERSPKAR